MMMGGKMQWFIRILCLSGTKWDYAVFWKLRHRVPMVLTCEDAYYHNHSKHNTSESTSPDTIHDRHCFHDPLALALANMPYHVYPHGEGIVGQVAAAGSHRWISSIDHPVYPFASPEIDGWGTQFSVGIKTIVFVAVPHGVVQLGSFTEVNEDPKLLSYIRSLFSSLQDSCTCHFQSPFNFHTETAMQQISNTSSTTLHLNDLEKQTAMDQEGHFSEERLTKMVTSVHSEKLKVESDARIQPQSDQYGVTLCKTEDRSVHSIPETITSTVLTSDYASDNLVETMMVISHIEDDVSLSTSESTLTTEANPHPYFNQSTHDCLNSSDSCSVRSLNQKGVRTKDRQLIEDRIKQLRRLIPNGSKCSIDSLLEKTIKHMVFLQDAATKANKFSWSSKFKNCGINARVYGSGHDHGSCWAVEVGKDMKICPIVVENLNVDGQMLIEMSLEDCHNFLEIAESIRSLGLTILKALTETRGDKVCMSFVVEGRGNRVLHRTQVLWSLLQLLHVQAMVI